MKMPWNSSHLCLRCLKHIFSVICRGACKCQCVCVWEKRGPWWGPLHLWNELACGALLSEVQCLSETDERCVSSKDWAISMWLGSQVNPYWFTPPSAYTAAQEEGEARFGSHRRAQTQDKNRRSHADAHSLGYLTLSRGKDEKIKYHLI